MTDERISLRDYLDERHVAVVALLTRIEVKQDLTNGRIGKAEKAIAVLSWAYGLGVVVLGWLVAEAVRRP